MKFILWTIVWWGLYELDQCLSFGVPYNAEAVKEYGQDIAGGTAVLTLIIWLIVGYWIKD